MVSIDVGDPSMRAAMEIIRVRNGFRRRYYDQSSLFFLSQLSLSIASPLLSYFFFFFRLIANFNSFRERVQNQPT